MAWPFCAVPLAAPLFVLVFVLAAFAPFAAAEALGWADCCAAPLFVALFCEVPLFAALLAAAGLAVALAEALAAALA